MTPTLLQRLHELSQSPGTPPYDRATARMAIRELTPQSPSRARVAWAVPEENRCEVPGEGVEVSGGLTAGFCGGGGLVGLPWAPPACAACSAPLWRHAWSEQFCVCDCCGALAGVGE